jgi:hypothetical protein
MSEPDQLSEICRGSEALGPPIQNRKRERSPDRACAHLDASGSREREIHLHCSLCPADADCSGGTFRPLPRVGYGQNKAHYAPQA